MADCKPEAYDPLDYLDFSKPDQWAKYRIEGDSESPVGCDETRNLQQIIVEAAQYYREPREVDALLEFHRDENCISDDEVPEIRRIAVGDFPIESQKGFPIEFLKAIAHTLVGRILRWIVSNANRPQIVLSLFAALSLMAVLISRRLKTPHGDRPNSYFLGLAASGSGKDWPRQAIVQIAEKANCLDHIGPETLTGGAALMVALSNNPAMLFQFDEAGHIFRGMKGGKDLNQSELEALLLRLTGSAGNPRFIDKGYVDCDKNRTVANPCASFLFTSTPASIIDALDARSVAEGLVGRCWLHLETDVSGARSVMRTPPPDDIVADVRELGEFRPDGGEILPWREGPAEVEAPFADDALESFELAIIRWDALAKTLTEEQGASLWRRCLEKSKKLALILCAAEHRPPFDGIVIEKRHADLAIAMTHHLTHESLGTVRTQISATKRERDLEELETWLAGRRGKPTTFEHVGNRFRKWDRKYRREMVDDLIERAVATTEEVTTSGRKRTEIRMNA